MSPPPLAIEDFNAQFQVVVTRHEPFPAARPRAHVVGFTVQRHTVVADRMYIDVQVPFDDLPAGHLPEEVVDDAWARVGPSVRTWATEVLARDAAEGGAGGGSEGGSLVGTQLQPETLV